MSEEKCDPCGLKIDAKDIPEGKEVRIEYSDGKPTRVSLGDITKSSCYVITASYGEHSSQLRYVRAKCKEMFVENIFLFPFWVLYKYIIGEELAYLYSAGIYRGFIKKMIAEKILEYTKTKSFALQLYLIMLGLSGFVLLPIFLAIKLVRISNKVFSRQIAT